MKTAEQMWAQLKVHDEASGFVSGMLHAIADKNRPDFEREVLAILRHITNDDEAD